MLFFENLPETQIFCKNSENSESILINEIECVANTTKKCRIKNGIITPKIIDDFPSSSYISLKTTATEKQNWKKINEVQIKIVNVDSIEYILPRKPMLNSTASKTLLNEYSLTKEYKEDNESNDNLNSEKNYEQSIKVKILPTDKKENININISKKSPKKLFKVTKIYD